MLSCRKWVPSPEMKHTNPRRGPCCSVSIRLISYQSTVACEAAPVVMVSRITRHLCLLISSSSRVHSCRWIASIIAGYSAIPKRTAAGVSSDARPDVFGSRHFLPERRTNDESRDSPRQSCHRACSLKLVREYMRGAEAKEFCHGISEVY